LAYRSSERRSGESWRSDPFATHRRRLLDLGDGVVDAATTVDHDGRAAALRHLLTDLPRQQRVQRAHPRRQPAGRQPRLLNLGGRQ
jgi:hypothetical protein